PVTGLWSGKWRKTATDRTRRRADGYGPGMTFSIVARSADGAGFGVAVASKFLAVGAAVPAAAAGVGAIATQSYAHRATRPEGPALLGEGRGAALTLEMLTSMDEKRETRQAGIVDTNGIAATFTGSECQPWAGGGARGGQ